MSLLSFLGTQRQLSLFETQVRELTEAVVQLRHDLDQIRLNKMVYAQKTTQGTDYQKVLEEFLGGKVKILDPTLLKHGVVSGEPDNEGKERGVVSGDDSS